MSIITALVVLQVVGGIRPDAEGSAAASVVTSVASLSHPKTIVVTAQRPEASATLLAACLARHCSPPEDIAASIVHAENLFMTGAYAQSRKILLASVHRNHGYAAQFPQQVATLHRVTARLSSVNGLPGPARRGSRDAVDALKQGMSKDDPQVILQRIEIGDTLARIGRPGAAIVQYNRVANDARLAHLPALQGMALFRSAQLWTSAASAVSPPAVLVIKARKALQRIEANRDPAFAPYRNGARLMRVSLASTKDKPAELARAMATMEPQGALAIIAYAPIIDMNHMTFGAARGDYQPRWVDVSFWIAPDGRVRDIATIQQSADMDDGWLALATKALSQRRYLPLDVPPGSPGLIRVERYLFVSDLIDTKGSSIPTRNPQRRVEVVDLTPAADLEPAAS